MKSDITSCGSDSKVLRGEDCVLWGRKVVGDGEEGRYMGKDNAELYSQNSERLELSVVWVLRENWKEGRRERGGKNRRGEIDGY